MPEPLVCSRERGCEEEIGLETRGPVYWIDQTARAPQCELVHLIMAVTLPLTSRPDHYVIWHSARINASSRVLQNDGLIAVACAREQLR